MKESLFNILSVLLGDFSGTRVLDIFAGTGNLGIEALSRGAASAVFIDSHRESVGLIQKNIDLCGFTDKSAIVHKEAIPALQFLDRKGERFRVVFLDPPYGKTLVADVLKFLESSRLIDEQSIIIVERSSRDNLSVSFSMLDEFDKRTYGETIVSFFRRNRDRSGSSDCHSL